LAREEKSEEDENLTGTFFAARQSARVDEGIGVGVVEGLAVVELVQLPYCDWQPLSQ